MQQTLTNLPAAILRTQAQRRADRRDDVTAAAGMVVVTIAVIIAACALLVIVWTLWQAFSNPALWGPEAL